MNNLQENDLHAMLVKIIRVPQLVADALEYNAKQRRHRGDENMQATPQKYNLE